MPAVMHTAESAIANRRPGSAVRIAAETACRKNDGAWIEHRAGTKARTIHRRGAGGAPGQRIIIDVAGGEAGGEKERTKGGK